MKKITYYQVGDNYETKDPVKKILQVAAAKTSVNLKQAGFPEVSDSRGESAFVWKQNNYFMASVIEGLGTKDLVADEMDQKYYEVIGYDTVATIINDLISVGAKPLVINAYWAIGDNSWFKDSKRFKSFVKGWVKGCNDAGVTWGGGETATLKGIVDSQTIDLAGSAVGIIKSEERLITEKKLKAGDAIILLKSNGINANGLSLVRAIANKLPFKYQSRINDKTFGELILKKTNIYARLIQNLLDEKIDLHYLSNITGHGLRKIMRAKQNFTYIIEKIIPPANLFLFIQKQAGLSNYEMYQTFNMGMDYAIFLAEKDINKTMRIISDNGFKAIKAGYLETGPRQVIIKPKSLIFKGESLNLR